jgi:hypothetical protein
VKGTVRVWGLADDTPVGEPITGHVGGMPMLAVGQLPDGTPVIVSVGLQRHGAGLALADGTPFVPPLYLPESGRAVAVHDDVIITAAGTTSPSTNQRSRDPYVSCCPICGTGPVGETIG